LCSAGFEVSLEWEDGRLKQATLLSLAGKPARLRYGDTVREVRLAKGEQFQWNGR